MNVLTVNLLIFRIVDFEDESGQLHNGYQILFTGDFQHVADDQVSAELVGPTSVLVTLPAVPSSFLHNHDKTVLKIQRNNGKLLECVRVSYATAVTQMLTNTDKQFFKVLVEFDETGETFTNNLFSPESTPFGPIEPEPIKVVRKFQWNGKDFQTTEMYVAYNVARIETEVRRKTVKMPRKKKSIAAALEGTSDSD